MNNCSPISQRHEPELITAKRPNAPLSIAVTGIHSTLGAAVLAALVEDQNTRQILCIDLKQPQDASPKLIFEHVDLAANDAQKQLGDLFAQTGVDCVAHLAFRGAPSPSPGYSHELESIGTMRVVQACLTGKVKKLVLGSRTWLYGASPGAPALIDEQQPVRARRSERYFADKIDAERDVAAFRAPGRGRFSTILRFAPTINPAADDHIVRVLSDWRIPSILGFDPMWQLTHVQDAARAVCLALLHETPAVLNIASSGAVPLSAARRMFGTRRVAMPRTLASVAVSGLWLSGLGRLPPSLLDYLQYPCVADCELARKSLDFHPEHSTLSVLQQAAQFRSASTARSRV
jgi:UDP-glucose 4-epimerase